MFIHNIMSNMIIFILFLMRLISYNFIIIYYLTHLNWPILIMLIKKEIFIILFQSLLITPIQINILQCQPLNQLKN